MNNWTIQTQRLTVACLRVSQIQIKKINGIFNKTSSKKQEKVEPYFPPPSRQLLVKLVALQPPNFLSQKIFLRLLLGYFGEFSSTWQQCWKAGNGKGDGETPSAAGEGGGGLGDGVSPPLSRFCWLSTRDGLVFLVLPSCAIMFLAF